jgi:hypothetical protein
MPGENVSFSSAVWRPSGSAKLTTLDECEVERDIKGPFSMCKQLTTIGSGQYSADTREIDMRGERKEEERKEITKRVLRKEETTHGSL